MDSNELISAMCRAQLPRQRYYPHRCAPFESPPHPPPSAPTRTSARYTSQRRRRTVALVQYFYALALLTPLQSAPRVVHPKSDLFAKVRTISSVLARLFFS